jgi:CubicO group peptidase (beta-lactamase class C family)
MLTAGGSLDGLRLLAPETIDAFTTRTSRAGEYPLALGWMTGRPAAEGFSSAGTRMGPRAFGHTGFTGTSVWIDPDSGLWLVLLTNRTFPERGPTAIGQVRAAAADLVAGAIVGGER